MHRLLVETELLNAESPTLPKDAARHLKVLRPKDGEEMKNYFSPIDLSRVSRATLYWNTASTKFN